MRLGSQIWPLYQFTDFSITDYEEEFFITHTQHTNTIVQTYKTPKS